MLVSAKSSYIKDKVEKWHKENIKVALVPTMGAIHSGHISLIKKAKKIANKIIVTIFVNPTQFSRNEDFNKYPRTRKKDLLRLRQEKVSLVFIPKTNEIYSKLKIKKYPIQPLSRDLCGKYRPHHFPGVCDVVVKLTRICQPDVIIFGEKDYQQFIIIKNLFKKLKMTNEVISSKTIRDEGGLALSSRNKYFSETQQIIARKLFKNLKEAAKKISHGESIKKTIDQTSKNLINVGFKEIEYFELRKQSNLKPTTKIKDSILVIAIKVWGVRLIDNIKIN